MKFEKNIKKVLLIIILLSFVFIILPKNTITSFSVYQSVNEEKLETLKIKAEVECLKNSQCSEGFECVENKCVDKNKINLCQNVKLFSGARKLKNDDSINSIKEVLTDYDLPFLLADGELVEITNNKLIEYFYIQTIFIGENNIEKEDGDYAIKINNEMVYTYKLMFSKAVDFSNENIRGQVLRILGKEYVIADESDNSKIILISNDKTLKLEDGEKAKIKKSLFFSDIEGNKVNLIKRENGNIIMIEILFKEQNRNSIKNNENYADSVFDAVKLSFNGVDFNGFADVGIGGEC